MLNVFLTIDTELWPVTDDWRESGLAREMDIYMQGMTAQGEFGLPYQMTLLNRYGLKAVFFVESLFSSVVGPDPLRHIVNMIQRYGHEVQLHIHTEWLSEMRPSILLDKVGQNMKDFSEAEQTLIIRQAIHNLQACDARPVRAFRAGNFGANFDTLRALSANGLVFDTSYNVCYLDAECGLRTASHLLQPIQLHGIYEFPISFFCDWPQHYRHAQLCACSSGELEHALLQAWESDWYSFVIVFHSFELIKRPITQGRPVSASRMVIRRFERLCRFLATHSDKFHTTVFSEVSPEALPGVTALPREPIRSSLPRTLWRFAEQCVERAL